MDEEELEKLREQKRQQKKQQAQEAENEKEQQKQQIKQQASKYLTSEAQSRLGNIRAAQPDKASSIEMQIAQLGKHGQISENEINDDKLKQLLRDLENQKNQNQSDISHRNL